MSAPKYAREIPQRYRLEAVKCQQCQKILFPPRLICPSCRSRQFDKVNLKPEGKVLSYTIIRVAPSQFVDQAPYAVGIIELDDGARIMAQITDCDLEKLAIDMRVNIEFRKIYDEGESGIICYGYKAVPQV
jgi:uncharacterized OB-fold protein